MSLMVIQRDREREREIVDNREGTMLKNKYFSKNFSEDNFESI